MDQPKTLTAEPIRLVVWDLDDTFWTGTIAEGEIDYLAAHHGIVIELARRGIMSSICSKNDPATVRARLVQEGLWDYFIFPSISWDAKGARLRALVDAVQLRPESILFIDDNPLNLAEAQFHVPGLQVAGVDAIAGLLDSPLCRGKDDRELSRLKQYQLLQQRAADGAATAAAGGSNHDFLRGSNIRVSIDYDVRAHLDRAIELINRTNQLNFTKARLSERRDEAARDLSRLIKDYRSLAGLVRVQDNYGDYGFCGIFVIRQNQKGERLVHFAFSCRIMNMGVEQWLYHHLGRPKLKIVGEAVGDPRIGGEAIDWITLVDPASDGDEPHRIDFDTVYLRGSCDLRPLAHFFGSVARAVEGEFTFTRGGAIVRPDHSLLMRYAAGRPDPEFAAPFQAIGISHGELSSPMFGAQPGRNIYLLSFNADLYLPVYRHHATGKLMPFPSWERPSDVVRQPLAANGLPPKTGEAAICALVEDYAFVGATPEALFRRNVREILDALPRDELTVVLMLNEGSPDDGTLALRRRHNESIRMLAAERPWVETTSLLDFVRSPNEMHAIDHFDRRVYTRLFEHVRDLARERLAGKAFAKQPDCSDDPTPAAGITTDPEPAAADPAEESPLVPMVAAPDSSPAPRPRRLGWGRLRQILRGRD